MEIQNFNTQLVNNNDELTILEYINKFQKIFHFENLEKIIFHYNQYQLLEKEKINQQLHQLFEIPRNPKKS